MNLKNYTTEVPAVRSIEAIEKLLIGFGSTNIMKEYGPGGKVAAISFIVEMDGMKLPFRLPAKVDEGYKWFKKQRPKATEKTLREQSERMVWKQLHEWVFIQLSMIELNQAEKLEVFFPYLHDVQKGTTYYQQIKEGKFKALLT